MAFFPGLTAVPTAKPHCFRLLRLFLSRAPCCEQLVSILRFDQPWGFNPVYQRILQTLVSPVVCDCNFPDLSFLWGFWPDMPWISPPFFRVSTLLKFFCISGWYLRCRSPPPLDFLPTDSDLFLNFLIAWVIVSPSSCLICHQISYLN